MAASTSVRLEVETLNVFFSRLARTRRNERPPRPSLALTIKIVMFFHLFFYGAILGAFSTSAQYAEVFVFIFVLFC